jgi:phytoene synthase
VNSALNDSDKQSINDTNAYEYCVNKAIPDGSNLYYATLFEKPENKVRIITFQAFLYELSEIIKECSDPGVARIKLKWWQEEIERLFNKQSRHPVTRQMQECIDIDQNLKLTFDNVIEFFNHFIIIEQTDSLDTILSLYKSTYGEIWIQCSRQLNQEKEDKLGVIGELGALIHYISCLQQPHTYINETRCVIPASFINNSELQSLLVERINRAEIQKNVFSPLISELKTKLDKTHTSLKEIKNVKYDLIMNRFAFKTCSEILADNCNLLDRNISLTPLRKLWIAWHTRTFG